jgi:hypothetical protein
MSPQPHGNKNVLLGAPPRLSHPGYSSPQFSFNPGSPSNRPSPGSPCRASWGRSSGPPCTERFAPEIWECLCRSERNQVAAFLCLFIFLPRPLACGPPKAAQGSRSRMRLRSQAVCSKGLRTDTQAKPTRRTRKLRRMLAESSDRVGPTVPGKTFSMSNGSAEVGIPVFTLQMFARCFLGAPGPARGRTPTRRARGPGPS